MNIQQMGSTNVDDSLVFFHRAQDVQTTEFPFSAVGGEDRRCANTAMYRGGLFVDEGKGFLGGQYQQKAHSNIV